MGLRWKVALDLPVDHQGWHPTSLTKFRARLLLHGKEALALENTLRLAEEIGLLTATAEQIIDSTPMLGAAATQDTVRLVCHGVRRLLDVVTAADQSTGGRLDDGLEFDYARPGEKPDCRWREKAERERMLTRVAQDAERALRAVEHANGLLDDQGVEAAHRLLRELVGQDFDVDSDGVPRLHRGTAAGRIISTVDPEMRHGRKSRHQRFDGYKLSTAATNTPEPLITAVEVAPASEQDGPQTGPLIDGQPAGGARSGCWATVPMELARSALTWLSATLRCSPGPGRPVPEPSSNEAWRTWPTPRTLGGCGSSTPAHGGCWSPSVAVRLRGSCVSPSVPRRGEPLVLLLPLRRRYSRRRLDVQPLSLTPSAPRRTPRSPGASEDARTPAHTCTLSSAGPVEGLWTRCR